MLKRFSNISCFVFDMDGVLTDGSLLVLPNAVMARTMNIKDGFALQLAVKKGYQVMIVSGGNSPEAKDRLMKLGINDIWMEVKDKVALLKSVMEERKINPEQVLYMGDDIPDLLVMQTIGLPVCPSNAAQDIKGIALYISNLKGGEGCVRDVIERVLKLRGDWDFGTDISSR
jgi:3-deoxy-D-manno-octulosonate 8-phosphate phosphatase (KDO 8-P phosphatase)